MQSVLECGVSRAGCRWDTDGEKRVYGGTRMRSRSDGCIRGPGWLLTVPEGAHFGEAGGGRRFRRPQRLMFAETQTNCEHELRPRYTNYVGASKAF